jgi:hypothetical protein
MLGFFHALTLLQIKIPTGKMAKPYGDIIESMNFAIYV